MTRAIDTVKLTQDIDGQGNLTNDGLATTYGSNAYNQATYSSNAYNAAAYSSNAYVQVLVDDHVSALVNSAPTTLDTLNELAAALGDDPNFATTVTNTLATKAANSYVNSTFASNNYVISGIANLTVTDTIQDQTGDVRTPAQFAPTGNTIPLESGTYSVSAGNDTLTTITITGNCSPGDVVLIYNNGSANLQVDFLNPYTSVKEDGSSVEHSGNTIVVQPNYIGTVTLLTSSFAVVSSGGIGIT